MAERKLCSNTASFSVPRYIDSVPVNVRAVESTFVYAGDSRYVDMRAKPNYRLSIGRALRISQTLKKCMPD